MSPSAPVAAAPAARLIPVALLKAMGVSAAVAPVEVWSACLSASCAGHGIITRLRLSAFLANAFTETGLLQRLSECLDYSAEALLAQWPTHFSLAQATAYGRTAAHPANQRMVAELAYGGRNGNGPPGMGDGWLFRGAGCLQTTGRTNHAALARTIGWTRPLTDVPAYLQTPAGAAESAAVYWEQNRCSAPADRGDIKTVRRIINGGTTGLPTVQAHYGRLLRLLPA